MACTAPSPEALPTSMVPQTSKAVWLGRSMALSPIQALAMTETFSWLVRFGSSAPIASQIALM